MSQTVVETSAATAGQAFAILRLEPAVEITDDQFFELCQLNRDLRLERTAQGDIIVMPPTGFETGNRNTSITGQLYNWSKKDVPAWRANRQRDSPYPTARTARLMRHRFHALASHN